MAIRKTPTSVYYNLNDFVHHGGEPLNPDRSSNWQDFVNTTNNIYWKLRIPTPIRKGGSPLKWYHYKLCALGGISVCHSFGDSYGRYAHKDEGQYKGQCVSLSYRDSYTGLVNF